MQKIYSIWTINAVSFFKTEEQYKNNYLYRLVVMVEDNFHNSSVLMECFKIQRITDYAHTEKKSIWAPWYVQYSMDFFYV